MYTFFLIASAQAAPLPACKFFRAAVASADFRRVRGTPDPKTPGRTLLKAPPEGFECWITDSNMLMCVALGSDDDATALGNAIDDCLGDRWVRRGTPPEVAFVEPAAAPRRGIVVRTVRDAYSFAVAWGPLGATERTR